MLQVWTNLPEALIPEAVCCGISEAAACTPTKTAAGPEGDFLVLVVCDQAVLAEGAARCLAPFRRSERSVRAPPPDWGWIDPNGRAGIRDRPSRPRGSSHAVARKSSAVGCVGGRGAGVPRNGSAKPAARSVPAGPPLRCFHENRQW